MEKDFNDIELIDRYLTGELNDAELGQFNERLLTDYAFKQEVAVYKKIYEGIKQAQRDNLKKSLDVFYDEYAEHEAEEPVADNLRSINWRRNLYIISGIAAAVLIFVIAYSVYRGGRNADPDRQAGVKNGPGKGSHPDTAITNTQPQIADHKKIPPGNKPAQNPDSGRSQIIAQPKDAYALTNQEPLPATSIRRGTYPEPLAYTFTDGELTIYGDPLMAILYLNLYKHDGRYYASIDGTVYEIEQAAVSKRFVKQDIKVGSAARSAENIAVTIAPLKTSVYTKAAFSVMIVKDGTNAQYYFTKDKTRNNLVLQGDFSVSTTRVVYVKKEGAEKWYVVQGADVYAITRFGSTPTPLKTLSGDNPSEEARMFFGREAFQKAVSIF